MVPQPKCRYIFLFSEFLIIGPVPVVYYGNRIILTLYPVTDCTSGFSLASHTLENPYLCSLRRGLQPACDISIFRTGLHRSPRSKLPNAYEISDLLGILTSRLEWPEARISVGTPLRYPLAIGDSLPHRAQSIGLEILIRIRGYWTN